jgi:uncharacterized protein
MFTRVSPRYGVVGLAIAGLLALSLVAPPAAVGQTVLRDSVPVSLKRDYERSQTLWIDLAERGDTRAQTALGFLYYIGLWLDQNDREAFNWFEAAAVQGTPEAQYYLGTMFLRGRGIGANASAAYFWCELSVAQGVRAEKNLAHSCREEAAKSMSQDEIKTAELRVKSWQPTTRK